MQPQRQYHTDKETADRKATKTGKLRRQYIDPREGQESGRTRDAKDDRDDEQGAGVCA